MEFDNVYDDARRAEAYSKLEFPGTDYLAYRDIPGIIARHVRGRRAMDFGCGTGRSTRFLEQLGFEAVGVDIARDMLMQAQAADPDGDYRLVEDGNLQSLEGEEFDLVLSVFTFDNIPTMEKKVALFSQLRSMLSGNGVIVSVVSAPEIYVNEWASFSTRDFPENRRAKSGDRVKIIITDVDDKRPVEDVVWGDDAYREVYDEAGLGVVEMLKPLGKDSEPIDWVNETRIAPWVIYVLGRREDQGRGRGAG
ncbi:MAG: class I SAM-dependent methyltransferase [bacterium]|jgi:SAM-dependent methyltransferase